MKIEIEGSALRLSFDLEERAILNFASIPESTLMTLDQFRAFLSKWFSVYLSCDSSIIEDIIDWMLFSFPGYESSLIAARILERIHGGKVSPPYANSRLLQMLSYNVRLFDNLYKAILKCHNLTKVSK